MTQLSPTKVMAPIVGLLMCLAGCVHAPETEEAQNALVDEADQVLAEMIDHDPRLQNVLNESYAYVVFPYVGQGGFIVAGGSGSGVVYEQGRATGFAELRQGSVGAQLGGQTFSELVVFENQAAFDRFRAGNFDINAMASTTIGPAGVVDRATFEGGVGTFIYDERGFMVQAAIGAQTLDYVEGPMG